jgi:Co/Zn/Cd efflux system component
MPSETARTVVVALAAGLAVAVAKLVAAIVTGSPAMTAEASHSFADFANDLFLLVAQIRSHRAPDDTRSGMDARPTSGLSWPPSARFLRAPHSR